jgi:mono/diheme cytochrome c family protein
MTSRLVSSAVLLSAVLTVGACSQDNTGDTPPPGASSLADATFLLFPNPLVEPDGSLQTNSVAYAQAYYAAIDPTNARDTLAKWKAANLFDSGTGMQVEVVFGDVRDLGYGRRMIVRQNANGTIAAVVENYMVETVVDYTFTGLNLEAAVQRVPRWHDNINAIEFSPDPGSGASFVKFFQFNPETGARELTVELDGRGEKAMPGPCLACHGGRADPLTPTGAFPLVPNTASGRRGDVLGRMMPLEVGTFAFSATPGLTRADQEAALKTINQIVLCSYPIPVATAFPEDACRRTRPANGVAGNAEWPGTAAALIKAAYGGDSMPNTAYSDTFVPAGWVGQEALYQGVVAPTCRACHIVRGSVRFANPFQPEQPESRIDLNSFAKFQAFADRTKAHVFDRGNMPLGKIIFEDFWNTGQAGLLATFLEAQLPGVVVRDGSGALLRPGRPVADPGPGRTIPQGPTTLSASGSLFSTTYAWSVVSGPNGAVPPTNFTLTNTNSARPTFSAAADGTYVLQLVTGNGATQSAPAQVTLVVNNALTPVPSAIRFVTHIKPILQQGACSGCHAIPGASDPPIVFTSIDRNGDGTIGDATDDLWFYTEVRGRINFTDIVASPLLRKPAGFSHRGAQGPNFNAALPPGDAARASYDLFLNWILNGAPM